MQTDSVRLFFPEVRRGGEVVEHPFDVSPIGAGDALRRRVRTIVDRPSRVGWRPPGNRGGDAFWREARRHHHEAFGIASTPRLPDERNVVALSHGIGEAVAEGLFAPIFVGLARIDKLVGKVAMLSRPADVDPWAPTKRGA